MSKMTGVEINALALTCGFIGRQAQTIAAIALAESDGETTAHNSKPPDDSYGLTQINMIGSLGPDRRKKFGISKNEDLFDPVINLKAAKQIYNDSGFNAWTTYKKGTYKDRLDEAGTDNSPIGNAANAATNQFSGISNAINAVGTNLFKTGANLAGIIIVVVLLAIGTVMLIANSKTGKSTIGKVASVASPGGKIAAVAKVAKKVGA